MEIGDGLYESVLEFQIPGTNQPLDSQQLSLEATAETAIQPVKLNRKRDEFGTESINKEIFEEFSTESPDGNEELGSKKERREELSKCLSKLIDTSSNPRNGKPTNSMVEEDVHEEKVLKASVHEDEELLSHFPAAEETKTTAEP